MLLHFPKGSPATHCYPVSTCRVPFVHGHLIFCHVVLLNGSSKPGYRSCGIVAVSLRTPGQRENRKSVIDGKRNGIQRVPDLTPSVILPVRPYSWFRLGAAGVESDAFIMNT